MDRATSPPRRWSEAGPLAVLAVAVALLFPDAALGGRFFFERDIVLFWHPLAEAFARVVESGSPPLWNPWSSFGAPLLATPNAQILYPPTWLLLVLTPWTYYKFYVLFHVFLAGAGLYAVGRGLGVSRTGSLVGGLVGVASGPWLSLVSYWNHLAGAAWLPWIVLAGESALSSRRAAAVVAWSLTLAMAVLAGSPEMGLFALVANAVLGLRHAGWPPRGAAVLRLLRTAAFAVMLALALSAGQWLPSLDLALRSARAALPTDAAALWSLHPASLFELFIPLRLDDLPLQPEIREVLFRSREAYLRSVYLGLPALALVGAALAGRRGRLAAALCVLFLIAVLGAVGSHSPFHGLVLALAPPLRAFRYPVKALILGALAWALLAALGYDACREGVRTWRRAGGIAVRGAVLAGIAISGGLLLAALLQPDSLGTLIALSGGNASDVLTPPARSLGIGLVAAVAALLLTRPAGGPHVQAWSAPLLAGLVVGDLVLAARGLNPTVPKTFFAEVPPILEHLKGGEGSRVYVVDYAVPGMSARLLGHSTPYLLPEQSPPAPWAMARALRNYLHPPQAAVWGLEGSYEADWLAFQPTYLDALTRLLWFLQGSPEQIRLLQLGAVSRAVSLHTQGFEGRFRQAGGDGFFLEPIQVLQIPDPLPRAFAVSGVRTPRGHRGIAEALLQFDPWREVLLTEEPEPRPVSPSFTAHCRIVDFRPDRMRLDVDLSEDGYVVMIDTFDPDWQARIDDQPARVLRANVAFRAVPTPAGRHTIDLVYRPRSVTVGLAVSGLALAGFGAFGAIRCVALAPVRFRKRPAAHL